MIREYISKLLSPFTRVQKLQIFSTFGIIGLQILIYLGIGLLNGFDYLNTWIIANIVPVSFFVILPFSLVPVYSQLDDIWTKAQKQFTQVGIVIMIASVYVFTYFEFNPPTTGFERLAASFARFTGLYAFINFMISGGITAKKMKDEE